MKSIALTLSLLLAVPTAQSDDLPMPIPFVPFIRLIAVPESYLDSEVRTVGVIRVIRGEEYGWTIRLTLTREHADHVISSLSVVLRNHEDIHIVEEMNGRYVMLSGRFVGTKTDNGIVDAHSFKLMEHPSQRMPTGD